MGCRTWMSMPVRHGGNEQGGAGRRPFVDRQRARIWGGGGMSRRGRRVRGAGAHQWVAGRVSGAWGTCLERGARVWSVGRVSGAHGKGHGDVSLFFFAVCVCVVAVVVVKAC